MGGVPEEVKTVLQEGFSSKVVDGFSRHMRWTVGPFIWNQWKLRSKV